MELGYPSLSGRRLRTSAQRSSSTSVESLGKGNDDSTYMDSSHQFLTEAHYPQTNYAARISSYSYHDPGPAPWMSGGSARPFSPLSQVREPPTGNSTVLSTLVYQVPFAIPTDISEQRTPSPALSTPIPGPPREFQSYPIASASPFPSDYHHHSIGQSHDTRDGFRSVEGGNSPDFLGVPAQSTTQLHRFDPLHFVSNAGPPDDKSDQTSPCNPSSIPRTDNGSSILMCNNSESSSPRRQSLATFDPPLDDRSRSVTDSNLPSSRDVIAKSLYSSKAGPYNQLAKKKKSKMHACDICGKSFPRPSGLRTHMNTHNNVKPYPCGFPGCRRSFAVRSNAKRHLRTHGVLPPSSLDDPAPYVVGFNTPTVMPPLSTQSSSKVPFRLRWMPPSLVNRSNADSLKSLSDPEYSDDEGEPDEGSALSIPLRAAIPSSSHVHDGDKEYEERNSYINIGSHPYHPSQV